MPGRLARPFFDRPTARVAHELLGCTLWVDGACERRRVRIVETEAYVARDEANHSHRGMTRRNHSMFAAPGTLYVYRIHQVVCANVVTRTGEAVLIRSAEPLGGIAGPTSGPGRLCRTLGLTLADDGADAVRGRRVGFLARQGPVGRIGNGPRVGVTRAIERPLRFALADSAWVSSPRFRLRSPP